MFVVIPSGAELLWDILTAVISNAVCCFVELNAFSRFAVRCDVNQCK